MSKKKEHQHEDGETAAGAAGNGGREAGTPPEQPADADRMAAADGETPQSPPQTPEEVIEGLQGDLRTAGDRYLRLMAEFDNYKKRTVREYERMVESANEKLMTELIHVRNTFELALKHGETSTDYLQLFEGIKLIFTKFDGVLAANGLTPFGAAGEPFDPSLHDALMKMPHTEIPDDHVADIYEKGYRLKDRVIKHARVIVSSGKPPKAADAQPEAANAGEPF